MYLYKCIVFCFKIMLLIKNLIKIWDIRVNISVFDIFKFGIVFIVKYIIRFLNIFFNNNL